MASSGINTHQETMDAFLMPRVGEDAPHRQPVYLRRNILCRVKGILAHGLHGPGEQRGEVRRPARVNLHGLLLVEHLEGTRGQGGEVRLFGAVHDARLARDHIRFYLREPFLCRRPRGEFAVCRRAFVPQGGCHSSCSNASSSLMSRSGLDSDLS